MQLNASAPPDPVLRSPGLRAIVGSYDIHRWPLTVPVRAGETFESWLSNVAIRYAITPRMIAEQAHVGHGTPLSHMCPWQRNAVTALLGQPEQDWPNEYWWSWSPLPRGFPASRTERVERRGRYCPQCLTDAPYWRFCWSQPTGFICPDHGLFLRTGCPACGAPPWSTRAWEGLRAPMSTCRVRRDHTNSTGQRTVRAPCGLDLSTAAHVRVDREVVAALNELTGLTRRPPDAPHPLGALATTTGQARWAYLTLLWLAGGQDAPTTMSKEFTHALTRAHRAYRELSSPTTWGPTLDTLLCPGGPAAPLGPSQGARTAHLGPILAAAALRAHSQAVNLGAALMFRTSRRWPVQPLTWLAETRPGSPDSDGGTRLPQHAQTPEALPTSWIPQVAWASCLPDGLDPNHPHDRALFSMVLIKLGRANRWAEIAFELDLPAHAQHRIRRRVQRLTASRRAAIGQHAEDVFAQLLTNPPPLDYRQRRLAHSRLGYAGRYLQDHLSAAQTHPGGSGFTPTLRAAAVRRYWERATGGDIAFASHPLGLDPADPDHDAYARARPELDAYLQDAFDATLSTYLPDRPADEPLDWAPT